MKRRRAVPPKSNKKQEASVVYTNINEIIRRLLIETEGGNYGISIKGTSIGYIWQTVPGYSRDISFFSRNSKDKQFFTLQADSPGDLEIGFNLSLDTSGSKVVTLSTKHKSCKTQKEIPHSIDTVVTEKSKFLVLSFEKLKTRSLVCFNGKL